MGPRAPPKMFWLDLCQSSPTRPSGRLWAHNRAGQALDKLHCLVECWDLDLEHPAIQIGKGAVREAAVQRVAFATAGCNTPVIDHFHLLDLATKNAVPGRSAVRHGFRSVSVNLSLMNTTMQRNGEIPRRSPRMSGQHNNSCTGGRFHRARIYQPLLHAPWLFAFDLATGILHRYLCNGSVQLRHLPSAMFRSCQSSEQRLALSRRSLGGSFCKKLGLGIFPAL